MDFEGLHTVLYRTCKLQSNVVSSDQENRDARNLRVIQHNSIVASPTLPVTCGLKVSLWKLQHNVKGPRMYESRGGWIKILNHPRPLKDKKNHSSMNLCGSMRWMIQGWMKD
jgi:hypothetical protein